MKSLKWIDTNPQEFIEEINAFLKMNEWEKLASLRGKGSVRRASQDYPRGTTNLSLKFWKTVNDLRNS